ncbi:chemotaxis protein CheW [Carboxylicivirga caseinilyticus]|uniref:chemotaxis protein CheW n=1 Tax=Carboxylicivirga caseinilyticus TaxID=3417572 RepID=UPI003D3506B6|nr:purine-binding chemotaxis protein CheW [Marinilabiliaceae bacterium A049]
MSELINAYLTFSVGTNTFGVHVGKVVEILEYEKPKSVPESLPYITGVIDHRENIVPVIDTGLKFNLGPVDITPQTCIVVLEIDKPGESGKFIIGAVVDSVSDVFESEMEKIKTIENDFKPGYISATYKTEENLVMILNTEEVFNDKDIIALDEIRKSIEAE